MKTLYILSLLLIFCAFTAASCNDAQTDSCFTIESTTHDTDSNTNNPGAFSDDNPRESNSKGHEQVSMTYPMGVFGGFFYMLADVL